MEEHSPPNLAEYVRVRATPSGQQVRFVYDCPDFEEARLTPESNPRPPSV